LFRSDSTRFHHPIHNPQELLKHKGEVAPSVMMPLPDPTFFVNKFDDLVPASPIAPGQTLAQCIETQRVITSAFIFGFWRPKAFRVGTRVCVRLSSIGEDSSP